jgi:hypothetical protein
MVGFVPIFTSQDPHQAPRRVTDMQGRTVVCHGDMVTTAFYRYTIDRQSARPCRTGTGTGDHHRG